MIFSVFFVLFGISLLFKSLQAFLLKRINEIIGL
jgi:hypothetical protein